MTALIGFALGMFVGGMLVLLFLALMVDRS